jgi:hypothetical protein
MMGSFDGCAGYSRGDVAWHNYFRVWRVWWRRTEMGVRRGRGQWAGSYREGLSMTKKQMGLTI